VKCGCGDNNAPMDYQREPRASKIKVFGTYNKAKKRVAFKGDRYTNPAYNNRVKYLITKMFW